MKYIIGLTGQTGAGKSELSLIAAKHGIKVIDCDRLYHQMLKTDDALKNAISEAFGDVFTDGAIDRKKLAAKAFCDQNSTRLLNQTVLPFVNTEVLRLTKSDGIYLLDAPTLFESGIFEICNKIIGIIADMNIRKARITERDSLSPEQAKARLLAAKDDTFFIKNCDIIIKNNGTFSEFCEKAVAVINDILKEANNPWMQNS